MEEALGYLGLGLMALVVAGLAVVGTTHRHERADAEDTPELRAFFNRQETLRATRRQESHG